MSITGRRSGQRGAVAIIVGLTMVAIVGFAGLAIDGGRLYVNKTELQNASDACALAASFELTGAPNIALANFPIAEDAGQLVASRNRVGFQGAAIDAGDVSVEFGTTLTGGFVGAGAATADAKYVRCTIQETGITPWFMQVLGFGDQTVRALATASLVPSQNNCIAIPIGMCSAGSAAASPPYGLQRGQWFGSGFSNSDSLTGSFNWIDFSPPAGGASELRDLLLGSGACTIATGSQVGNPGAIQSIRRAWNTRFGIYHPSMSSSGPGAAVPDRSGYAYRALNWPSQANALTDFIANRRSANAPYGSPGVVSGNTLTGLDVGPNGSTVLQPPALATQGAERRLAIVPIIDCAGLVSSQTVPVLDWACVFMLHPMDNDNSLTIFLEYHGLTSAPGSPCPAVGGVGNSASTGPLVPGLVQ
ncbi:MAG: hypothetical protein H0W48_01625 [Methylibium sp.]|nr:hypothetical protein [Methylibium sp.]MBA3623171.1 hypothetical protein [Methylibium sp.]